MQNIKRQRHKGREISAKNQSSLEEKRQKRHSLDAFFWSLFSTWSVKLFRILLTSSPLFFYSVFHFFFSFFMFKVRDMSMNAINVLL